MKLSTLIHWMGEGNTQEFYDFVKSYLNDDYRLLFKLLEKNNLLDDDVVSAFLEEELFTEWFSYMYYVDPQYVIDYIIENYFDDVKLDGNRYWLSIDKKSLADLFETNRWGEGSRGIAKKVLSDDYEEFFNYVEIHNLEDDVISELNPDNLNLLKEAVYQELEGQEIEIDGETDIITLEKVMDMDEDELSDFIKDHTPDVYGNLSSLYNSSYEYAYEEEVYNDVMRELKSLFGVENFSREVPYKRKTYKAGTTERIEVDDYLYQVDVTNLLPEVISGILDMGGYNSDNDFEYYGSFEGVMNFFIRESKPLSFTAPDYADFQLVSKNLNEMFRDYI